MKMLSVAFDDEGDPQRFTFAMSLDEIAVIYAVLGHMAPLTVTEHLGDVRWGNALNDVTCDVGNAFNTFYDDGVYGVLPRVPGRAIFEKNPA